MSNATPITGLSEMLTATQRRRVDRLLLRAGVSRRTSTKLRLLGEVVEVYEDAVAVWLTEALARAGERAERNKKLKRRKG